MVRRGRVPEGPWFSASKCHVATGTVNNGAQKVSLNLICWVVSESVSFYMQSIGLKQGHVYLLPNGWRKHKIPQFSSFSIIE